MSVDEREFYYRQRNAEIQKGIVNYKSSSTSTSDSFIWTYRTTSCDVISLITTTVPVRNGLMDDIKLPDREIKRLKPASKKQHSYLQNNPLDAAFYADRALKRKQVNEQLVNERRSFMTKLYMSRHIRSTAESEAATIIQAIYRGHYTRRSMYEIAQYAQVNKQIRSNIRSYLANKYEINTSLSRYKRMLMRIRNRSAVIIQCAFFCYISRICVRRRRHELLVKRRRDAAITIQALARGASARARVALLVERIRIVLIMKSVIRIQAAVRKLLAKQRVRIRRYKLRWIAGSIIQNFYKSRYSHKMAQNIRAMMAYKRQYKGALKMQCCVRCFLSKRRVDRVRLRRLHKLIFRFVTVIQTMIRRFLARVRVQTKRVTVTAARATEAAEKQQRIDEEVAQKEAEETKALLESVNIFIQARKGNTTDVDDIYTGLVSTEEHHATDVEPGTGDTVLHIAAAAGNLDLVRKCLIWRFDPNQRNIQGYNAFMVAARNDRLEVMKYIISPPPAAASDTEDTGGVINLELPISEEDAGFLMVTAAANAATSGLDMIMFLLNLDLDINAKNETTGMMAVHAACEVGHVEVFKLLVNRNCELEAEDDLGQLPVHKACQSSLQIVKLVLGLDPNFSSIYMSEQTRVLNILRTDADGKDCLLHAALAGQTDTLKLLEKVLEDAEAAGVDVTLSKKVGSSKGSEDISWSAGEITRVLKLIETDNIACIEKLKEVGYDFSFAEDGTGRTSAIAACQGAHSDSIDLIMSYGVDFTVPDSDGNTAFHHAAQCSSAPLLANLLTHRHAAKCNISEKCLLLSNNRGDNVFHTAALVGVDIQIDLLAQGVLKDVLSARNKDGLTPLQVACSYGRNNIIHSYIKLGSDAQTMDPQGRSCMWHLFHVSSDILSETPDKRPICSEFNTLSAVSAVPPLATRKEVDEDVLRVTDDVAVVTTLLRAGCSLYSEYGMTPEDMRSSLLYQWDKTPSAESQKGFEPGDIAVQEMSVTLFKNIVAGLISPLEGWRLLLASIWFDDGSAKVITALMKAGVIDLLCKGLTDAEEVDAATPAARGNTKTPLRLFSRGTPNDRRSAAAAVSNETTTDATTGKRSKTAANAAAGEEAFPVSKLHDIFFLGISVMGWAIKLLKPRIMQFLIKKGYDCSLPVDLDGNNALHFASLHGSADMVDILLSNKKLRFEAVNTAGYTAGMLAAKQGNFAIAKRLFYFKISPRRCLDGSYAAWVLAFVRKAELNERNLQTGRYGDDDETYFDISPDPFYITWYAP